MRKTTIACCVAAAGTALASISVILAQAGGQTPIYLDPKRPVEERIDDLMSRMTLKEKVGQLNLVWSDIPSKMEACKKLTAGTYTQEIGPGLRFFRRRQSDSPRRCTPASGILQTNCKKSRSPRRA